MFDITSMKGYSKMLQAAIIAKANSIMDSLALMDLKLKEQKIIEKEIENIKLHPGNISSNLGNNLPWKERLEEIVNNAASIHSEFDVTLHTICNVMRKINLFVDNMERTYVDSRNINQPGPETQYYPNDQTILPLESGANVLGPNVGHYNHNDPLMNGDLPFPHHNRKSFPVKLTATETAIFNDKSKHHHNNELDLNMPVSGVSDNKKIIQEHHLIPNIPVNKDSLKSNKNQEKDDDDDDDDEDDDDDDEDDDDDNDDEIDSNNRKTHKINPELALVKPKTFLKPSQIDNDEYLQKVMGKQIIFKPFHRHHKKPF